MTYDTGSSGRLHGAIVARVARLARDTSSAPRAVLDVGCGTGRLLDLLTQTYPNAQHFAGVDPAPSMLAVTRERTTDARVTLAQAMAERLPFPTGTFDLVVTSTSFDHWTDQAGGLAECARVMTPEGVLLLADRISAWLVPTLVGSRKAKARTRSRVGRLLTEAGFGPCTWHPVFGVVINAVVASRQGMSQEPRG